MFAIFVLNDFFNTILTNEYYKEDLDFFLKTLPFCLAALAISISIQVKNKTVSFFNALLSVVIGVSCAWITGNFINTHFSPSTAPIIIGVVTIAGEKVGYWLIYKFNFDVIGQAIAEWVINFFRRKK